MALAQVNSSESKQVGPSKLENAAKILGIVSGLSQAGMGGYKTFVTEPQQLAEMTKQNKTLADLLAKKS